MILALPEGDVHYSYYPLKEKCSDTFRIAQFTFGFTYNLELYPAKDIENTIADKLREQSVETRRNPGVVMQGYSDAIETAKALCAKLSKP
jgi:hypothetical protein